MGNPSLNTLHSLRQNPTLEFDSPKMRPLTEEETKAVFESEFIFAGSRQVVLITKKRPR